ncbi:vanadium-dependent haloperoxidase [Actinoplanes sp. RD1]|uniref:vanadium-dependent haloperoxidase n=1 Tax=Actinoplanes sp. RD1 TaxID=3064538 RepID=UPI0027427D90|nr:vanadium-dependent haloperoxidase [Actinoplanes sp. RD1]
MARFRTLTAAATFVLAVPFVAVSPAAAGGTTGGTTGPDAGGTTGPNAVVTWHLNAQNAIYEVARQPPYIAGRSFAIVSGAVYDAVNAIAGTPYEPLLAAPRAHRGDSVDAAVATAAYRTLLWQFPAQAADLQARYDAALAAVPDGPAERGGIAVGTAAAETMITARTNDGSNGPATWTVGTAPGQWRPTPPTFASDAAFAPDIKPFVIRSGADFRTPGAPALTSAEYARELNEVKALGGATSTVRTQDQTESAKWWHDRRMTEWQIRRNLATSQRLSPLQTARLFAMTDVVQADGGIACFTEKRRWSFWRPVTAVQLADTDGNPATTADPAWMPLLITPGFPEYPSGHSCSTGGVMATLRAFFGRDGLTFSAFSEDSGTTRTFTSFSQATAEVIEARIWGGVHFRSADEDGVRLGEAVSRYILAREFRPRR